MKSPKHDRDITSMSERALLEVLVNQPVRITMDQMRGGPLSGLREKGFVVCGQEMVNCTAIHAHDGDVIVMGEPSLAAWIVIKPAGREWLQSQGIGVPDRWGTVKLDKPKLVLESRLHHEDLSGERMLPLPPVVHIDMGPIGEDLED